MSLSTPTYFELRPVSVGKTSLEFYNSDEKNLCLENGFIRMEKPNRPNYVFKDEEASKDQYFPDLSDDDETDSGSENGEKCYDSGIYVKEGSVTPDPLDNKRRTYGTGGTTKDQGGTINYSRVPSCDIESSSKDQFFPDLSDDDDDDEDDSESETGLEGNENGYYDKEVSVTPDPSEDSRSDSRETSGSDKEHRRPIDYLYSRVQSGKAEWRCNFCSFQTDEYHRMRYHAKMGHRQPGEKLFTCNICSKKLSTPSSYQLHVRSHQVGSERKFKCSKCGDAFKLKHHLRRHDKAVHLNAGEKPKEEVKCLYCPMVLASTQSQLRHMKSQHGEAVPKQRERVRPNPHMNVDDGPVQCEQCGKSFKNTSAMKVHSTKKHSTVDNTKYRCVHCGKMFKNNVELRYHVMRHTGAFPFSCEKCGGGYPSQSELRKHLKRTKCGKEETAQPLEKGSDKDSLGFVITS